MEAKLRAKQRRRVSRLRKRGRGVGKGQGWDIFQLKPSFPGQAVSSFKVHCDPIKLTTTVTTGQISSSTSLTSALITSFATRFAGWDEYRFIRAFISIRCFASTNPGLIRAWIEPRSSSSPTLAIAEASEGLLFSASDVGKAHILDYKVMDPVLVDFNPVNTSQNIGYLNVFTNNANYGASIVATDYLNVDILFTVQFRGLA